MSNKEFVKKLGEPLTISRLVALKMIAISVGLGAITALLSATIGVILVIAAVFLIGIGIYNLIFGDQAVVVPETPTKTTS